MAMQKQDDQQLCEDTGCNPEDLPEAMNDGKSGKRGSGISVLAARRDDEVGEHSWGRPKGFLFNNYYTEV